ncbi:MAG TPA: hypothetical protein VGM77_13700 [Gemmatimonadales bacterium]
MTRPLAATSSAPVRLDFAGGWTDVEPIASAIGGAVVNAAIDLRTTVTVRSAERYSLRAADLALAASADSSADFASTGPLALHAAALRWAALAPCAVSTAAAAPAGSGLGTSGALGVALVHALSTARDEPLHPIEIAERAWTIETVDATVAGGRQDQYAAALGGVQHLEMRDGKFHVSSIAIAAEVLDHLAQHIVVCHTGRSRFSGSTISRVVAAWQTGDQQVHAALLGMRALAQSVAPILQQGDVVRLGELLQANWQHQQALDRAMVTPAMAALEVAMRMAGATGGKAAGSGAGGVMFFAIPGSTKDAQDAARACGATVLPLRWAAGGVRSEPGPPVPAPHLA